MPANMKVYILESHIGLMNSIVFRGVFASHELAKQAIPPDIRVRPEIRKYQTGDIWIYFNGNMTSESLIFTIKEAEVIS